MDLIRSFIALPLPTAVQESLAEFIRQTAARFPAGIRWVEPQQIHLTLAFLGESPAEKLNVLANSLAGVAAKHSALRVRFTGLGAFPSPSRVNVFWVGLEHNPELELLAKEVQQICQFCDYPLEKRPFHPHITLARIPDFFNSIERAKANELVKLNFTTIQAPFLLSSVVLYQSRLSHRGARYTPLKTYPLND